MPVKKKKHRNVADNSKEKELVFKDESGEQMYALVQKSLGSSRFSVLCDDGTERIGKLRGNMRRSQWVSAGCYVLTTTRLEIGKVDITIKYSDVQARQLKRYGELHSFDREDQAHVDDDETYIDFAGGDDDDLINAI